MAAESEPELLSVEHRLVDNVPLENAFLVGRRYMWYVADEHTTVRLPVMGPFVCCGDWGECPVMKPTSGEEKLDLPSVPDVVSDWRCDCTEAMWRACGESSSVSVSGSKLIELIVINKVKLRGLKVGRSPVWELAWKGPPWNPAEFDWENPPEDEDARDCWNMIANRADEFRWGITDGYG